MRLEIYIKSTYPLLDDIQYLAPCRFHFFGFEPQKLPACLQSLGFSFMIFFKSSRISSRLRLVWATPKNHTVIPTSHVLMGRCCISTNWKMLPEVCHMCCIYTYIYLSFLFVFYTFSCIKLKSEYKVQSETFPSTALARAWSCCMSVCGRSVKVNGCVFNWRPRTNPSCRRTQEFFEFLYWIL